MVFVRYKVVQGRTAVEYRSEFSDEVVSKWLTVCPPGPAPEGPTCRPVGDATISDPEDPIAVSDDRLRTPSRPGLLDIERVCR